MTMPGLGPIGQISRNVADIPRSVEWYKTILGLPHLFTFGDLAAQRDTLMKVCPVKFR